MALGTLALRQKDEVSAEREFKAALDLDPKSSATHTGLGLLYWSRNDLKAAEQEFKTAAELASVRSPIRLRYADFLLQTGAAVRPQPQPQPQPIRPQPTIPQPVIVPAPQPAKR